MKRGYSGFLGVTYKKDLNDDRESPALDVMKLLQKEEIELCYHDPFIEEVKENGLHLVNQPLNEELLHSVDLVIILTDHTTVDYEWVVREAGHVFDTRNATRGVKNDRNKITLL